MSKLDDDIRRAQKNAGNKLYRIRRKGAVNADELDPRLDRAEWRGMDYNAKRRYLRKLQNFTSRENRIYVQSNDVAVPEKLLKKYRALEKKSNSAKLNLRTSIERNRIAGVRQEVRQLRAALRTLKKDGFDPASDAVQFIRSRAQVFDYNVNDMLELVKRQGKVPERNKFSDLNILNTDQNFVSVEALKAAIKAQGTLIERITGNRAARYRDWQTGIASKLRDNGYGELAEQIFLLSTKQLDWLHYYTDFDAYTNMFKYEADYGKGVARYSDRQLDDASEHIQQLIDASWSLGGRKKQRIGTKAWAERWARTVHEKPDYQAWRDAWVNYVEPNTRK